MSRPDTGSGRGWRSATATWSAAAWMVLQQFGVPGAGGILTETRIVRSVDATRSLAERERLPDGRVITIPVVISNDDRNRLWLSAN